MESLVKESKVMLTFVTHMRVLSTGMIPLPIQFKKQLQEGYGFTWSLHRKRWSKQVKPRFTTTIFRILWCEKYVQKRPWMFLYTFTPFHML